MLEPILDRSQLILTDLSVGNGPRVLDPQRRLGQQCGMLVSDLCPLVSTLKITHEERQVERVGSETPAFGLTVVNVQGIRVQQLGTSSQLRGQRPEVRLIAVVAALPFIIV